MGYILGLYYYHVSFLSLLLEYDLKIEIPDFSEIGIELIWKSFPNKSSTGMCKFQRAQRSSQERGKMEVFLLTLRRAGGLGWKPGFLTSQALERLRHS